ncbi:hypothetical protein [Leptothrix discophora]|uniref:Uncharacterized protein n=1 Tax=Leptothrix discophora TaxID=89 RepID=A0ABT9G4V0_LEPDI|nr:hypothetical protein [Leptothrix discophora]MDP4301233.1 hypothetical protein [Leptothrix discophora]
MFDLSFEDWIGWLGALVLVALVITPLRWKPDEHEASDRPHSGRPHPDASNLPPFH